jgi:hypothetical protein
LTPTLQEAAFGASGAVTLESFQSADGPVWNHLKRRLFLLHPAALLPIDERNASPMSPAFS